MKTYNVKVQTYTLEDYYKLIDVLRELHAVAKVESRRNIEVTISPIFGETILMQVFGITGIMTDITNNTISLYFDEPFPNILKELIKAKFFDVKVSPYFALININVVNAAALLRLLLNKYKIDAQIYTNR